MGLNQRGLTLVGIIVVMSIMSIVMLAIAGSFASMTKQAQVAMSKRDQVTAWFILQKSLSMATVHVDQNLFRLDQTFGPRGSDGNPRLMSSMIPATPPPSAPTSPPVAESSSATSAGGSSESDSIFGTPPTSATGAFSSTTIRPGSSDGSGTSGSTASTGIGGSTSSTVVVAPASALAPAALVAGATVRNTIHIIPAADIEREASWLPVQTVTGAGVPIYQNSFTLRTDEMLGASSGQIRTVVRAIYAARCLPLNTNFRDPNGIATVDVSAPNRSAAYVTQVLNIVPFINTDSAGRSWLSCCPINAPCITNNSRDHVVRTYTITFQDGVLAGINESPSVGETNTTWGMGFMFKFDQGPRAATFQLSMFNLIDTCKSSMVPDCLPLSIREVTSNFVGYLPYIQKHMRLGPFVWAGPVSPDLANSGVLRLTQ